MTAKTRKAEQYVPHRLTHFKMARDYGASTPVHANANVKFQGKRKKQHVMGPLKKYITFLLSLCFAGNRYDVVAAGSSI